MQNSSTDGDRNLSDSPKMRILFVCHGNICRSTMAECIMRHLIDEEGSSDRFVVDSAATTYEEIGNPIYPPARRKLGEKEIPIIPHRARRIREDEVSNWDLIICMDEENIRHLKRIVGSGNMHKVHKLLEYTGAHRDVADPWYTGNFEETYQDVMSGCKALLARL